MIHITSRNIQFARQPIPVFPEPPPIPDNAFHLMPTRIKDGDGFLANLNGEAISVRLLGLDAPELFSDSATIDPHGYASMTVLHNLIYQRPLLALFDRIQPRHDRYARTLLWIWRATDLLFINGTLILAGAARTRPDFPSRYTSYLNRCQQNAKAASRGIWRLAPHED